MIQQPANDPQLTPLRLARLPDAWSPAGGQVALLFRVNPSGPGWTLQGEDLETLVFASGAAAERQGRRLAQGLAKRGRDAQVNVYDRRNLLAGTIRYFGLEPGGFARGGTE